MKQRIISGVIIAAAVIGLGVAGSYPLYLILMLCSLIGYIELTAVMCPRASGKNAPADPSSRRAPSRRALSNTADRFGAGRQGKNEDGSKAASGGRPPGFWPDAVAIPGILLTVLYYAGLMFIEWRYGLVNSAGMISAADFWTVMLIVLDFFLTMGIYVYTFPKRKSSHATAAAVSFLYVPVLMSFICRTRNLRHGIVLYLLIFICSSVSDVCALAAGMTFGKGGKHRLAPELSPKKTIEGAIGGIVGSAAASCAVALVLRRFDPSSDMLPVFLIIGICGSIIGQTGDLAASAIKRNHNIKDYGNLIPGHGGIMDRFDSVLFTAPLIYYLSFLMMDRL